MKDATLMTDEEVRENYEELRVKRRMRNMVNMNLSVAEDNMLCKLTEELNYRKLDVEQKGDEQ